MELEKLKQAKEIEKEINNLNENLRQFNSYVDSDRGKPALQITLRGNYAHTLLIKFYNLQDFLFLYKSKLEAEILNQKKQLAEL